MGFILALIVGLIAGALNKLIMPRRRGGGVLAMLLGMAATLVAGALWREAALLSSPGDGRGIVAAAADMFFVLATYGIITRRRGLLY